MTPLILVALGSGAFGLATAHFVGALADSGRGLPPSHASRKVFHVLIFTGAAPAHIVAGFWGVVVYGSAIAALVLVSVARGEESALYRGLARRKAVRGGRASVLVPLLATVLGGLTGVLMVGDFAIVGYLVAGWGDAAGEWTGRRWGRHTYASPLAGRRGERRSIEGSIGVAVVGGVGAWVALEILGVRGFQAAEVAIVCAVGGSIAEGLSGEGTDNFWLQVVPSIGAWWLAG